MHNSPKKPRNPDYYSMNVGKSRDIGASIYLKVLFFPPFAIFYAGCSDLWGKDA